MTAHEATHLLEGGEEQQAVTPTSLPQGGTLLPNSDSPVMTIKSPDGNLDTTSKITLELLFSCDSICQTPYANGNSTVDRTAFYRWTTTSTADSVAVRLQVLWKAIRICIVTLRAHEKSHERKTLQVPICKELKPIQTDR